jgi:hypothetical protein
MEIYPEFDVLHRRKAVAPLYPSRMRKTGFFPMRAGLPRARIADATREAEVLEFLKGNYVTCEFRFFYPFLMYL